MSQKDAVGTVYLIHITDRLHYLGWTEDLETRLADHRQTTWVPFAEPHVTPDGRLVTGRKFGPGATLLGVANSRGQAWSVTRIWEGTRAVERRLKDRKGSRPFCPECSGQAAYSRACYDTPETDPRAYETAGAEPA